MTRQSGNSRRSPTERHHRARPCRAAPLYEAQRKSQALRGKAALLNGAYQSGKAAQDRAKRQRWTRRGRAAIPCTTPPSGKPPRGETSHSGMTGPDITGRSGISRHNPAGLHAAASPSQAQLSGKTDPHTAANHSEPSRSGKASPYRAARRESTQFDRAATRPLAKQHITQRHDRATLSGKPTRCPTRHSGATEPY